MNWLPSRTAVNLGTDLPYASCRTKPGRSIRFPALPACCLIARPDQGPGADSLQRQQNVMRRYTAGRLDGKGRWVARQYTAHGGCGGTASPKWCLCVYGPITSSLSRRQFGCYVFRPRTAHTCTTQARRVWALSATTAAVLTP